MITLISHAGTCCIGINTDAAAITDPALFRTCIIQGINEILALRLAASASATWTPRSEPAPTPAPSAGLASACWAAGELWLLLLNFPLPPVVDREVGFALVSQRWAANR
jgi:hypothetical protein